MSPYYLEGSTEDEDKEFGVKFGHVAAMFLVGTTSLEYYNSQMCKGLTLTWCIGRNLFKTELGFDIEKLSFKSTS